MKTYTFAFASIIPWKLILWLIFLIECSLINFDPLSRRYQLQSYMGLPLMYHLLEVWRENIGAIRPIEERMWLMDSSGKACLCLWVCIVIYKHECSSVGDA